MTTPLAPQPPLLIDRPRHDPRGASLHGRGLLRAAALALLGSALLTASAKVQVPLPPVPMTMQSLVVVLIGMAYGSRLGAATVLVYLAQGLVGLPVFAGPAAGPAYMAGPTGGYLLGFLPAAAGAGWLAERGWDRGLARVAAVMVLGHALILAPGVAWLAALVGGERAVAAGLVPFVAGTLVKSALGAAFVAAARPLLGRRAPS